MENKRTKIIVGFYGIGKTHCYHRNSDFTSVDLDTCFYNGQRDLYFEHIEKFFGLVDFIFVPVNPWVREYLFEYHKEDTFVVYPNYSLKNDYLERYRMRGSSEEFTNKIGCHWNMIMDNLDYEYRFEKIKLNKNEYLNDIIYKL